MSTESQLPVAFWGDIAPLTTTAIPGVLVAEQPSNELEDWRRTFTALELDLDEQMERCIGADSPYLDDKTMLTFEDVYRHCVAEKGGPPPEKRTRRPGLGTEQKTLIAQLTNEWHEAVRQRNEAVRKWDEYVSVKRAALKAARANS